MDNPFLQANLGKIKKLKTHLLELEMMGSYQEVPVSQIRHLFDGLILEISKLQGVNNELTKLIPKKETVDDSQQSKKKGKGK